MPGTHIGILNVRNLAVSGALAAALTLSGHGAGAAEPTPQQQAFRQIYQELMEINTTDSVGNVTTAANAVHSRRRAK